MTRAAWIAAAAIALCVALAWIPAYSADWVQWDDDRNFTEHAAWRGLTRESWVWMWTSFHMGHYQPLSWLTLALDYEAFGLDARGFHATNVVLHAATAVALVFLARRVLAAAARLDVADPRLVLPAAFAAGAWALHPLRVESVSWITERRDVLGALFFVLAVHAWTRRASEPAERRGRWYAAAIGFTLLSLLAKAAAIVMPAVLLVLDAWPLRRSGEGWRRLLAEKIPFGLLSVVFGALALAAQASADEALAGIAGHGPLERAVQAGYALAWYLGTTLLPTDLIPIRELPAELLSARYVVPALLALSITAACIAARRRAPALLAAWSAYALILAPVSGLAQAGPQLVADRYAHYATLPFALLAGGGALVLARRSTGAAWVASIALVAALGLATHAQARAWRDTPTLWRHVLAVEPANGVALHNLGSWHLVESARARDAAERRAHVEAARELFERGERDAPAPRFEVALGVVAGEMAELEPERRAEHLRAALERLERGVRLGAERGWVDPAWRFQLGAALLQSGRAREAIVELERAAHSWSASARAQRVLSLAYAAESRWSDAAAAAVLALREAPEDPLMLARLGTFLARAGRAAEARAALERALAACGPDPALAELARGVRAEIEALPAPDR